MKRQAIKNTIAHLQKVQDSAVDMSTYGWINKNGTVGVPGCLAQHVVLANRVNVDRMCEVDISRTADNLLGLTEDQHIQLFLTSAVLHNVALNLGRQNAINVLQRILDTNSIDWRPETDSRLHTVLHPVPADLDS